MGALLRCKKRLRKIVDKKKQFHFQTLIAAESKSNNKSLFETFNLLTGKESGSKPNLTVEQCQEFYQFFTSVAEKLNKKCKGNWNPNKIPQVRCSMYLPNVTNDEVEKIVMSLITKYTSDCFEISDFVIQSLIFGILDTLTFLINKELKAQTFTGCLKRAVVVPIFKSGNVSEATNYKPISLLSAISKVFEKIIYIRMTSFLKHTNQLHNNQFGFRSKLGTIDALISVVDSIRYNLNKPEISTHTIFLDLNKAFDTVDHSILLEKLWRIGFRGPINTLLKSYLTNRKQKIRCGDTESSFLPL